MGAVLIAPISGTRPDDYNNNGDRQMRQTVKTVYQFSELSDEAKETAREWYREGALDYDWWSSVYDDAVETAKILGIEFNPKPVKLMSGATRYDPCIWFSGFSSQGDGACFEGVYRYAKGAAKAIRKARTDERLHRIADDLQAAQQPALYRLEARTAHSGHYYHSGCMDVDASRTDDRDVTADQREALTMALRGFADWIYRQLEDEQRYQLSDEVIDETIIANEYEFYEGGRRAS